ncbi:hypothetical protein BJ508DRAFT_121538 [Ascobolus immersus RN42]|uniref:Uncharacterized protein n=1 Tax=Ascobolus immersus RN42 TaxID=1160509 RepID=A0A3N4IZ09_ASCIM|nr:hypothetical protein BJ508DRAFT_121538 [Ascobolus immersus RN42]
MKFLHPDGEVSVNRKAQRDRQKEETTAHLHLPTSGTQHFLTEPTGGLDESDRQHGYSPSTGHPNDCSHRNSSRVSSVRTHASTSIHIGVGTPHPTPSLASLAPSDRQLEQSLIAETVAGSVNGALSEHTFHTEEHSIYSVMMRKGHAPSSTGTIDRLARRRNSDGHYQPSEMRVQGTQQAVHTNPNNSYADCAVQCSGPSLLWEQDEDIEGLCHAVLPKKDSISTVDEDQEIVELSSRLSHNTKRQESSKRPTTTINDRKRESGFARRCADATSAENEIITILDSEEDSTQHGPVVSRANKENKPNEPPPRPETALRRRKDLSELVRQCAAEEVIETGLVDKRPVTPENVSSDLEQLMKELRSEEDFDDQLESDRDESSAYEVDQVGRSASEDYTILDEELNSALQDEEDQRFLDSRDRSIWDSHHEPLDPHHYDEPSSRRNDNPIYHDDYRQAAYSEPRQLFEQDYPEYRGQLPARHDSGYAPDNYAQDPSAEEWYEAPRYPSRVAVRPNEWEPPPESPSRQRQYYDDRYYPDERHDDSRYRGSTRYYHDQGWR